MQLHYYNLLCVVLSFFCFTTAYAQDCSSSIKDAHQLGQAQLVRSQVKILVMRGVDAYSTQFVCDKSGLQLKVFSKGSTRLDAGDELIFGSSAGDFLNIAFENIAEESKVGENTVSINSLQLDQESLQWLNSHSISTLYIRLAANQDQLRKYTLDPQRQSDFTEMIRCFKQTLQAELINDRSSNAQVLKYPGEARMAMAHKPSPSSFEEDNSSNTTLAKAQQNVSLHHEQAAVETARQQLAAEKEQLTQAKNQIIAQLSNERQAATDALTSLQNDVKKAREQAIAAIREAEAKSAEQIQQQHEQAIHLLAERENNLKQRLGVLQALEQQKIAELEAAIAEREALKTAKLQAIQAEEAEQIASLQAKRATERDQLLAEWEKEKQQIAYAREKMHKQWETEQAQLSEALTKARAENVLQLQAEREASLQQVKESRSQAAQAIATAHAELEAEVATLLAERAQLREKHQQIVAEMNERLVAAKSKIAASVDENK